MKKLLEKDLNHKIDLRNKDELNSILKTLFLVELYISQHLNLFLIVNAKLYYDNNVGSTENLLEIISSRKEKLILYLVQVVQFMVKLKNYQLMNQVQL